jgi:hypothetical protein
MVAAFASLPVKRRTFSAAGGLEQAMNSATASITIDLIIATTMPLN